MDHSGRRAANAIHDDLKGLVRGELLFDDLSRVLYATDACSSRSSRPASSCRATRTTCRRWSATPPSTRCRSSPRGAGTGLAGEALGAGLVVDLSVHFRQILEVGATRSASSPA